MPVRRRFPATCCGSPRRWPYSVPNSFASPAACSECRSSTPPARPPGRYSRVASADTCNSRRRPQSGGLRSAARPLRRIRSRPLPAFRRAAHEPYGGPLPIVSASALLRVASVSIGQGAPSPSGGQHEAGGRALIVAGEDVGGTVDGDVVDHHAEAIRALAGFADGAPEGDAGMGQIDHPAEFPRRTVAGVGNVHIGGQVLLV